MQNPFTTTFSKAPEYTYIATSKIVTIPIRNNPLKTAPMLLHATLVLFHY